MKKILILLLSASMLIVASCEKSEKESDRFSGCLLISVQSGEGSNYKPSRSFSYDEKGRIVEVKDEDGLVDQTYKYTANQIIRNGYLHVGSVINTYNLDASGKVISSTERFPSNYLDADSDTEYIYNSEGFLIQVKRKGISDNQSYVENYGYTNGNLTSTSGGFYKYKKVIYYNDDVDRWYFHNKNHSDGVRDVDPYLRNFFGKNSKNLISKIEYFGEYGYGNYSENLLYEKDKSGNITKLNIIQKGHLTGRYDFFSNYKCK
jgi:hypothetical protein